VTFPNFTVEPEHIGAVYPDYNVPAANSRTFSATGTAPLSPPDDEAVWLEDRRPDHAAQHRLSPQPRSPHRWEMPNEGSPLLWLSREYLDQALKARGSAGWAW